MSDAQIKPSVLLIMGSKSDWEHVKPGIEVLRELKVGFEVKVASAHRTPEKVSRLVGEARSKGIKVIIAVAGAAAHLAGVVASHTLLPVLGVPVASTPLAGFDALLSMVQMPRGMPVGVLSVGGAANASLLAAQILAISDEGLHERLAGWRKNLRQRVEDGDEAVQSLLKAP